MTRAALLLVDCQEDFLSRPGLTPDRDTLVAAIAARLERAREDGQHVIHVHTSSGRDGSDAMPHRRTAPEVIEVSAGAAPPPSLAPREGEPVFTKRFFSAFDAPGLAEHLEAQGIDRLELAGVHTHACIQATALDAYATGIAVELDRATIGSDRPALARDALAWLDGRAATVRPDAQSIRCLHCNPHDPDEVLFEFESTAPEMVADLARRLAADQSRLAAIPIAQRRSMLADWRDHIAGNRDNWIAALTRDVGKPVIDAEGEYAYGLALLDHVIETLDDREVGDGRTIVYRPRGLVGLITPWNNPFAIPIGKLAPALGFGNAVLWKPAIPGTRIARDLHDSLATVGFSDWCGLVTGDASTGRALADCAELTALSFTGSVPVGQTLIAAAGRRSLPIQSEMGGHNAAIVDRSADLDHAAADLAQAIFSFSGQRCTAIRRIIVDASIAQDFVPRLVAAVRSLDIGPVISPAARDRLERTIADAVAKGAVLLTPATHERDGKKLPPTLLANVPSDHEAMREELFGPIAIVMESASLDDALALHNATSFGLIGAIYTADPVAAQAFFDRAEAGMLSLNRARPAFAAAGPFSGWKASGFGPAEHGRWNRDFYTVPQAHYGRD